MIRRSFARKPCPGSDPMDLPLVFALLAAFVIVLYVLMDGFDLGVGLLFPFAPGSEARDVMMASVDPVWDGNETWLVMGGHSSSPCSQRPIIFSCRPSTCRS